MSTFRDVDPAVTGKLTCGSLRAINAGEEIVLRGWVNRRRDLGGLIFIDLRDRYGLTQIVFNPEIAPEAHAAASDVRNEYVLEVTGIVPFAPEALCRPGNVFCTRNGTAARQTTTPSRTAMRVRLRRA